MTFLAINHQHKVVNTHHCNIMTHGIMQFECTVERDPLQLALLKSKMPDQLKVCGNFACIRVKTN